MDYKESWAPKNWCFWIVVLEKKSPFNWGHPTAVTCWEVHPIKWQIFRGCKLKQRSFSQRYGFSSSHVWMWELDHKEGWRPKNWCFLTVMLKKTLASPLNSKETKPINSKGNESWVFIGRTDAKAEAPILWVPDAKNWLIEKDPDAGKDWRQEEKGSTEDEMVGRHHRLDGHEFE